MKPRPLNSRDRGKLVTLVAIKANTGYAAGDTLMGVYGGKAVGTRGYVTIDGSYHIRRDWIRVA